MRIARTLPLLLTCVGAPAMGVSLNIYTDSLQNGFTNQSWSTTYSLTNTSPVHSGTDSIRFVASGYRGIQFVNNNAEFNFADYQSVTFWINGGSGGGQALNVYLSDNYGLVSDQYDVGSLATGGTIAANSWKQVTLDFNSVGLTNGTFNGFVIQDATGGGGQAAVYVDDIVFNARTTALPVGASVSVSVDTTANVHSFSPLIFGVAYGDATRNGQIGYTVRRWGGNSTTRYNWKYDIHNTGNDYYYENIPDSQDRTHIPPLGNTADAFVSEAISSGAQPLIAIPTIGLKPLDNSALAHPYTVGFAVSKYGAQQSVDQYDTNAGNGVHTNGSLITGNSASDTSDAAPSSYEAQWIGHLQSVFGNATAGGVKFYSLDNEVMLWNSTHRDVHPSPPTFDEIWNRGLDYATAIKTQEPGALVTGPVTFGYTDLFNSAADAAENNVIGGASDRANHGGLPFVAWYLQQVCAHPMSGGVHVVDYLDLHWYPQGTNVALSNDDSQTTAARRLKSLRELYDSTWVSDSWIGQYLSDDPTYHYNKPNVIPRARSWINQYCPGTKLAITEYNWGNDDVNSGVVAQAEALAIFARDGVDMATRWVAPNPNSKAERAFQLFLNFDGAGAKVEGDSIGATTSNIDQIGAYGIHGDGRLMVLLTNKDTASHAVNLTLASARYAAWTLYGFDGTHAVHQVATGSVNGTSLSLSSLSPISANLLVIPDNDEIFKDGFQ